MKQILIALIFIVSLANTSFIVAAEPAKGTNKSLVSSGNEVPGLKLPTPQTVNYDEGFVTLTAECKTSVQWLVLSTNKKLKFKVNPATPNDIDIAIAPYSGLITIFAVGQVDGKLTPFARTDITVDGPPEPGPPEPPGPIPPTPAPNVKLPLHLSIIEDPSARTPAIGAIITSEALRTQLKNKQVTARVYSVNDPAIKEKKFTTVLQTYGAPMIILQDNTGQGLVISKLPATQAELLKLIGPYVGGF